MWCLRTTITTVSLSGSPTVNRFMPTCGGDKSNYGFYQVGQQSQRKLMSAMEEIAAKLHPYPNDANQSADDQTETENGDSKDDSEQNLDGTWHSFLAWFSGPRRQTMALSGQNESSDNATSNSNTHKASGANASEDNETLNHASGSNSSASGMAGASSAEGENNSTGNEGENFTQSASPSSNSFSSSEGDNTTNSGNVNSGNEGENSTFPSSSEGEQSSSSSQGQNASTRSLALPDNSTGNEGENFTQPSSSLEGENATSNKQFSGVGNSGSSSESNNSSSSSENGNEPIENNSTSGSQNQSSSEGEGSGENTASSPSSEGNEENSPAAFQNPSSIFSKPQTICFEASPIQRNATAIVCSSASVTPPPLPQSWLQMNNLKLDNNGNMCTSFKPAVGSKTINCLNQ